MNKDHSTDPSWVMSNQEEEGKVVFTIIIRIPTIIIINCIQLYYILFFYTEQAIKVFFFFITLQCRD